MGDVLGRPWTDVLWPPCVLAHDAPGRIRAYLVDWDVLPSSGLQGGVAGAVPNAQSADEDATLTFAQYRVPERRLAAGPLDRMPRRDRLAVVVDEAGVRELGAGGDPPVLSVDEEPRHAAQP